MPERPQETNRGSLVVASLWMVGLTLLLFFIPLFNGLIGGLVGGYKAGTAGRGLLAALLPAAVVALGLWVIFGVLGAPSVGLLAGAAASVLIVLADVGILIGGGIGGTFREMRANARQSA